MQAENITGEGGKIKGKAEVFPRPKIDSADGEESGERREGLTPITAGAAEASNASAAGGSPTKSLHTPVPRI